MHSDVISFHNYDKAAEFEKRILWLQDGTPYEPEEVDLIRKLTGR